jgi:hypothetical protein
MFPLDNEFALLYILYFSYFILSILDIFRNKVFRRPKSIVLVIGVILNLTLFLNANNFIGGGSLVVLFYSSILLLLLITIHIILYLKSNKKRLSN